MTLDAALSALGGLAAAGYIERTPRGWRLRKQTTSYRKAPDTLALQPPPTPEPDPTELPHLRTISCTQATKGDESPAS
ncbi:hypothetical protein GCM10020001_068000 [Nonomuraea salmonea]